MTSGATEADSTPASTNPPDHRPPKPKEKCFDAPTVLTVSAAHMVHDTYPSFLAPLLPLLIARLGIPLAAAGALATAHRVGTLGQPFLGAWADKADARVFVIVTPTVTALAMSLLGVAPNYLSMVVLLAVASFSHAAFHPAAAAMVSGASGATWGRGSSMYLFGGIMGKAIGPLFIVTWVTSFGLGSSYMVALPGVLFSLVLYLRLRDKKAGRAKQRVRPDIWKALKAQRRPLLLLSGLVLFKSTASQSFSTFYPTYLTENGSSLVWAGIALSVYELAGAMGALAGGTLSDRFGRRTLLLVSQLVAGPFLYLSLRAPEGVLALAALTVAGAAMLSASPVQLTLAQELLPDSRSTAAGITFFVGFEGTLISTLAVGAVADMIGLGQALSFSVFASMLSIPFILALPEPARRR